MLPSLDPVLRLAETWRVHHPGEPVPTVAEYAIMSQFTEAQARKWLVRCAASCRAAVRRARLREKRLAGLLPHELQEILDRVEANECVAGS